MKGIWTSLATTVVALVSHRNNESYLNSNINHHTNSNRDEDEVSSHVYYSSTSSSTSTTSTQSRRDEAARIMDTIILPATEYGRRLNVGRDAQGLRSMTGDDGERLNSLVIRANDPRLSFTYGEFPFFSLDVLLDTAENHHHNDAPPRQGGEQSRPQIVDMGSGCARLCLYLTLTRQDCDIVGIEMAPLLHQQALQAAERAVQFGFLCQSSEKCKESSMNNHPEVTTTSAPSTLTLYQGLAQDYSHILSQSDLVFAYSTTWDTSGFSTQTSSLLLSHEWNQLLTSFCPRGCIVITTDRSLDTSTNEWNMLAQLEVDNPEVGGSMGYIQQRI